MPTPMQAAIMSSGSAAAYVDTWFAANTYRIGPTTVQSLAALAGYTFTGASLRMGFDSTGAMTYGPNNLCLQSQTFGTTWGLTRATVTSDAAVAPDGTTTADKLVEDTATGTHRLAQVLTTTLSSVVYSIYLKAAGRSWALIEAISGATDVYAYINLSTGAQGTSGGGGTWAVTSAGNSWWRVSVAFTPASTSTTVYAFPAAGDSVSSYTGDGTSGIYLWGAQLEAVTYQTTPSTYYPTTSAAYYGARLVYDPVTLASQGILVEEARTNLCLQSQTFDNASWTKGASSITADATTSPDGTSNADKVVEAATTDNHRFRQTVTVSNTTAYTYSVYAKAAERTWVFVEVISGATDVYCYVNLATGALGATISGTWTVTSVGNGWYRISCTFTTATTTADCDNLLSTGNGTTSYAGDGTSGAYFWQAQLEAGTGASSPIPTTSASVTRAADVPKVAGIALSSAFSIVTEARKSNNVSGTTNIAICSDGTVDNRLGLYVSSTVTMRAFGALAGSGVFAAGGSLTAGSPFKQAVSFDGVTTFSTTGNGGAIGTATKAIPSASLTELNVGLAPSGSEVLNGTIARIRIYNRALTDAQLQALTA